MRMHAAGWRSRYVPVPLAVGEGPETWQAYFNQQTRWAFGCMDILRWHTPALVKEMSRRQAALYVALQQHYFSGIATAVGLVLLVTYFATGVTPADVGLVEMLLWVTPLVVARQLVTSWLQRYNPDPERDRGLHLAGRFMSIVTAPVFLLAAIGVLRQKRLVFKVTPKGEGQRDRTPVAMILPHVLIGAVTTVCLVSVAVTGRTSLPMLFWAGVNAVIMATFVGVVLATRTGRTAAETVVDLRNLRERVLETSAVGVHPHVVDDHLLRPGGAR